ncbi:hypothetical protein N7541_001114 [Penicillium brevicompactum]|uniref:DNA helicase n=1 Tax=Penicillium brevicompactum TaxID=5074 RepID=A0A9W9RVH6_PENBR|nr:hypothetical protein N7541_001114 [Penicillium brevicompactum]
MNSFEQPNTPTNLPQRKRRRSRPQALPPPTPASDAVETEDTSFVMNRAVNFLLQEHGSRVAASSLFPPEISPSHIRLPLEGFLDRCGHIDGFWNLCSGYHAALLRGSAPKFSAENKVNVTMCQHYPDSLKDLTLTKEYLIARSHPVGVIVKLRPGGRMSPANYHALRGHFIIIPQDPKPLLQILPSPDLQFTELIKVFWLGNRAPTDEDLRPFLIVRKSKVLAALQYLIQHNSLYGDVTVAHSTIYNWPDEFIPSDLQQHVISLDETDHNERVGYSVNLQEGNYENDWQAAEDGSDHLTGNSLPVTASVTVDVNGERQNPDMRLLNTMNTLIGDSSPDVQPRFTPAGHMDQTGLSYDTHRCPPDHHYFTSTFPTLFPTGIEGHLDDRDVPMSLAAFTNWALRHHSRRFSLHRTFMYLLYDVIQLRNSCLGNSLLIKRSQWASVTRDLNSLSSDRLRKVAEELAANQVSTDALVRRLLKNITAIGVQVPGSFFQKLQMRAEIRGLLVREGMPAFWLTINPFDLQNPLVLVLAGLQCSTGTSTSLSSAIRCETTTSDPVAVARFFHCTCKAVLDGLLGSKPADMGILGDVSNYFGVVESNGRGMLHLHTLVWMRGNLGFNQLRDRILADSHFADRMIKFLESVIMHSLHGPDSSPGETVSSTPPSPTARESDSEFVNKLFLDSNAIARTRQLHSKRHTATCFKYRRPGAGHDSCRFGMPRDLLEVSKLDEYGIVHLARNHAWVNPWNPSIASCIRSNHDISWIPTVSKSLSLLYYITNYATKDDVSPAQMVTKAALLKQAIDRANSTSAPNTADIRLRERGMDKFALRCFNSLSQDREISGVQVASTLLQLPSYYTLNYNFTRLNLWWLRRYVRSLIHPERFQNAVPSETIGEEPCNFDQSTNALANIFDNYKLRGDPLSSLCIFEYCMIVRTKRLQDATTEDIPFHETHPRHRTHLQRLVRSASQTATVTLQGELTEFQSSEDSMPGGHPTTTAIQNDLAEILLGLFIPWQNLQSLFYQTRTGSATTVDLHHIWMSIEPTLSPYVRTFAQNIELLRKSKTDCQADAILRDRAAQNTSSVDQDLTSPPYPISDSENESIRFSQHVDDSISKETLLAAFFAIGRSWSNEANDAQRRIPTLTSTSFPSSPLQFDNFGPIQISNSTLCESTGLQSFPLFTLQEWKTRLQNITKAVNQERQPGMPTTTASDLDDFNLGMADDVLVPILTEPDLSLDLQHRRSEIGQNPTGASLTSLVRDIIPLNEKQRLVVERVISNLLACVNHPYDSSMRKQTLLYVGGEGGVGKSQIIKAIVATMDLIHRKDEVILMAPTGAAADVIGGSTYHTSLGISLNRYRRGGVSPRIIFASFWGLPVVILMGDFHQFPPVQGQALWKLPRNDTEQNGKLIWNQFQQVIILHEQMRQAEDIPYQNLLGRAQSGTLTSDDLSTLNSKAITSLTDPHLQPATVIVKLNSLRHVINRLQIERFARARHQNIFVFPALHTRTRSSGPTSLQLRADDLLGLPEQGAKVPFPGVILYTLSMPTMVLTNICTPAGLVNGATGQAMGIAIDPQAEFLKLDDLYIFCTKPPVCLLFKPARTQSNLFQSLDSGVLPIFPLEMSITIKGYSVRRKQIPICPAFCLTDYKIQGATLDSVILDLKDDIKAVTFTFAGWPSPSTINQYE